MPDSKSKTEGASARSDRRVSQLGLFTASAILMVFGPLLVYGLLPYPRPEGLFFAAFVVVLVVWFLWAIDRLAPV